MTLSWGPSAGNSPEAGPVRVRSGEALYVLIMVDAGMGDLVHTGYFAPQHRRNVAVEHRAGLFDLRREQPALATILDRLLIHQLSQRVGHLTQVVEAL